MDYNKLKLAGIDYEKGIKRFGGSTKLFEEFLTKFLTDETYPNMLAALERKDYDEAFNTAHMLKGITGSLSLDTLFNVLVPLVETLRIRKTDAMDDMLDLVKKTYIDTIEAIQ